MSLVLFSFVFNDFLESLKAIHVYLVSLPMIGPLFHYIILKREIGTESENHQGHGASCDTVGL